MVALKRSKAHTQDVATIAGKFCDYRQDSRWIEAQAKLARLKSGLKTAENELHFSQHRPDETPGPRADVEADVTVLMAGGELEIGTATANEYEFSLRRRDAYQLACERQQQTVIELKHKLIAEIVPEALKQARPFVERVVSAMDELREALVSVHEFNSMLGVQGLRPSGRPPELNLSELQNGLLFGSPGRPTLENELRRMREVWNLPESTRKVRSA